MFDSIDDMLKHKLPSWQKQLMNPLSANDFYQLNKVDGDQMECLISSDEFKVFPSASE